MQETAHVSTVTLLLGSDARKLVLVPGIPLQELMQCVTAGFHIVNKTPVAVRHATSNVLYPLSLLCRSPDLFENATLHLVLESEQIPPHDYGRKSSKHRHRVLHSRKRGARAHSTPDRRNSHVLSTSYDAAANDASKAQIMKDEPNVDLDLDLSDFELPQLVNVFTQACPTGALDRLTFDRCLEKILSQSGRYDSQARKMFTRLFSIFEAESFQKDIVDVADFLGGVSVFACGERDEKIQLTFELYDMDGDGFITMEEMTKYFMAVFLVIGNSSPDLFQPTNINPAELGRVTAKQCFAESTLNEEGKLSYEAFREWYLESGPTQLVTTKFSQDGGPKSRENVVHSEGFDLATLREVTGLAAVSAAEFFSMFSVLLRKSDDTKQVLTRAEFKKCFSDMLEILNREHSSRIATFLDQVYDAFDEDGSDMIDLVELSSGLSVLCGGSVEDKITATFKIIDTNDDGYITQQEMQTYLASTYNVMYVTSPALRTTVGVDAKALAYFTSMDAFASLDSNNDGKMSLKEFLTWFWVYGQEFQQHSMGSGRDSLRWPDKNGTDVFNTSSFVASITGLRDRNANDVFEIIASKVNEDGVLSREAFFSIVDELVEEHAANTNQALSADENNELQRIIETIFDGFDTDHDGFVDFCQLSSGISVLCAGSQQEKISSAFSLFDINQDGFISRDEMVTYLASVYRIVFMTSPGMVQQLYGISPEELARITTTDAFSLADANHDDRLSFEDFTKWYSSHEASRLPTLQQPQQDVPPAFVESALPYVRVSSVYSKGVLARMGKLTNLCAYDVSEMFEIFRASADSEGKISQTIFNKCFQKLLAKGGLISRQTQMETQELLKELFELFDSDMDGIVDVQELSAGLSILCGGNRADKTKSMFTMYDVNHDGVISPDEMNSYLTSVFKVMFKASPDLPSKMGMMPKQLARTTTRECFRIFDKNEDGQLSFDEFQGWFQLHNPDVQRQQGLNSSESIVLPRDVLAETSVLSSSEANTLSIISNEKAKKQSGSENVSLDDVLGIFALAAGGGKLISRRIFEECLRKTICGKVPSIEDGGIRVHKVIDRLRAAFGTEQKDNIDIIELVSGLSILCGASSLDAKILAAFKIHDTNKDGVISIDEMTHYLGSVYKLLHALDPSCERNLSMSSGTLAAVTADEIFKVADVDQNGKLTFEDFKYWYSSPEHAPSIDNLAPLDLEEVRHLTNLGNLDVVEVLERFAQHANEAGMVNRESFDICFFEIYKLAHLCFQNENEVAKKVADRLYSVFNQDENGQINFSELASGLSVLCKGPRDAKVKAAFRLFDNNTDEFISSDGLKRYLTSALKVLYEVHPCIKDEAGISAAKLALVTVEHVFLESNRSFDAKLSSDDFLKWCDSPSVDGVSSSVTKKALFESLLPLNEMKQLSFLASLEPNEVLKIFACGADNNGLLSQSRFYKSFCEVIYAHQSKQTQAFGLDMQQKLQNALSSLFALFDKKNIGAVSFIELAHGVSVFCDGTKYQKVETAFSLIDYNDDGFISLDEMTRYLTSLFRVLFLASPDSQSLDVSPEELGDVTAQQVFAMADQDHDGQLTLEEFKLWYQQADGIGGVAKNAEQLLNSAKARRPTKMQVASPIEQLKSFTDCTNEQRIVSQERINGLIQTILSKETKPEWKQQIHLAFNRLKKDFDVDQKGMIDLSEISSGLLILCGGLSEDRIPTAFASHDYNADGYISTEEMKRYLNSAFQIFKVALPSRLQHFTLASTEELGALTADQAFSKADLDEDGRMGLAEFRMWYARSNAAVIERFIQNSIPEWLLVQELQHLTNLGLLSTQQLFETLADFAAADGFMGKDVFRQSIDHFVVTSATQEKKSRLHFVADQVFELLDKDKNGLVDLNEVVNVLSMLCCDTQADNVRFAFNLYDLNHDGYISLGEMRLYLTSMLDVLFEARPTIIKQIDVTPEELGNITAEQAFAEADQGRDGKLSFAEFSLWFLQLSSLSDLPVSAALGEYVGKLQKEVVLTDRPIPEWVSLDVVKQMTNLGNYSADEVFEIFANRCSENGTLAREAFEECFEQLVDEQLKNDEVSLARLRLILNRLFVIFDENNTGTVDFCELSSGLSVLCGGSREEKVRAAFSLYDLNRDGLISLDEMVRYLASVFKVLYETSPGTDEKLGVQPEDLAIISAEQCFLEANLNEDGKLSFDEFVSWYSKSARFEAPIADVSSRLVQQRATRQLIQGSTSSTPCDGSPLHKAIETSAHELPKEIFFHSATIDSPPALYSSEKIHRMTGFNDDSLLPPKSASALKVDSSNMEHVRQLLKLGTYEVNEMLEIFAEAAPSGELTFAAFKKCFDRIIRLAGGHESHAERQEADEMVRRLFRVFDTNNSNTVNFNELGCGLSVLSGSSMDDKIFAAFQLNHRNGNGFITQEEMIEYLASIFKVMYQTTDTTKTDVGMAPEEFARIKANDCFKKADLNGDEKFSIEEFKKWCTSEL